MPVINPISKLKKWLSKSKQEYDLNSLDGDLTELRSSTSEQSIESSEGSYQSADEDVFDSGQTIPKRSRSEGTLHKLKCSILNKCKVRHSQSDLCTQKHEPIRKFKSETEILRKQKKNRRSRSVVKSLLCAIPEARDLDSDTDIKQAQRTVCNNSRHSFDESSSFQYLSDTLSPECNLKLDSNYSKQHEEGETSQERIELKANVKESIPMSQPNKDEPSTTQTPHLNDCRNDWESKGARPKEFSTKRNSTTSSGISSMEDCLTQQSTDKSVEDYVESTLPYTRDGHCASSPAEMHEMGQEAAKLSRKWKSCIIQASNVQLNSFNGGASETNVNQRPIQAINPVEKMGSLKDMTDIVMKTFSTEEKVAMRPAFENILHKTQTTDESRIAVIIGHKGDGKTVCGKYMLQQSDDFKHKVLVNTYKDWQTVKVKHKEKPDTAIFIDDMFGTDRFRKSIYDKWQPFLDQIYAASTNGNISTIIAIDKKVFEKYLAHNNCHKLFANEHVIDLTGEFALKRDEMCNILKEHLRHIKNANIVRFCDDKVNDNTAEFVEKGDLTIWEGTLEQISLLPFPVGFPSAAAAFASSIENIKQGVEYFYSPQNSIVVSINEIRRSPEVSQRKAAFAIGTVVQNGGKVTLSEFEAEEIQIDSRKRSSKDIKKVKGRLSLKDALRGRILANEPITVYFREGLNEIEGNYVDIEEGNISFRCVPIHYSAAISFGKEHAVDVIAVMPFDFISKFVGPPRAYNDRQSLYISLDPATYQVLFERLMGEIEKKNVRLVMEHQYMCIGISEIHIKRVQNEKVPANERQPDKFQCTVSRNDKKLPKESRLLQLYRTYIENSMERTHEAIGSERILRERSS